MTFTPRTVLTLGVALAFLSMQACSKKAETVSQEAPATNAIVSAKIGMHAQAPSAAQDHATADAPSNAGTSANTAQQVSSTALSATPTGRQLVRTAVLRFTVKDVYLASLAIEDMLAEHNGFVVNSTINRQVLEQYRYPADAGMVRNVGLMQLTGELQVRLPSAKASTFVRSMSKLIDVLEERTLSANDVQFDLLRQQLEAARAQATAQDLNQLTNQAGRIADKNQTIAQRRQAAIEANEAQLSKLILADQVGFATVTVHIKQAPFVHTSTEVDFAAAQQTYTPSFASHAAKALVHGWTLLWTSVIALLSVWPALLVLCGMALLLKRKTRVWQTLGGVLSRKAKADDSNS